MFVLIRKFARYIVYIKFRYFASNNLIIIISNNVLSVGSKSFFFSLFKKKVVFKTSKKIIDLKFTK